MLDTDSTTALQVAYYHGNSFVDFDSVNHRVGVGTNAPQHSLDVQGDGHLTQVLTVDGASSNFGSAPI